jgi:hypothetical protein
VEVKKKMKLAQYLDLLLLTAGVILITFGSVQLGLPWILISMGVTLTVLGTWRRG